MTHSPDAIERAQQLNAFRAWNAANQRARDEYARNPIVTKSYPCATCTGHAYGKDGHCIACVKDGWADVAAGSRITYELSRADRIRAENVRRQAR